MNTSFILSFPSYILFYVTLVVLVTHKGYWWCLNVLSNSIFLTVVLTYTCNFVSWPRSPKTESSLDSQFSVKLEEKNKFILRDGRLIIQILSSSKLNSSSQSHTMLAVWICLYVFVTEQDEDSDSERMRVRVFILLLTLQNNWVRNKLKWGVPASPLSPPWAAGAWILQFTMILTSIVDVLLT